MVNLCYQHAAAIGLEKGKYCLQAGGLFITVAHEAHRRCSWFQKEAILDEIARV